MEKKSIKSIKRASRKQTRGLDLRSRVKPSKRKYNRKKEKSIPRD